MIEVRSEGKISGVSKTWVAKVTQKTLDLNKVSKKSVSVLLTTDPIIRKINREYLHHDYATDVISFWLPDQKLVGEEKNSLGDLVVSVDTARRVAKELKISFKEELARYLVHGVLHLLGYEDETPKDYKKMHTKQEALLLKIL